MNMISRLGSAVTTSFADAMADGRVTFYIQPVEAVSRTGVELYSECLVRVIDRSGDVQTPASFVPELEACGAIGLLDQHMIELVLSELERSSDAVLGCNISVDTIQDAVIWNQICNKISAQPELARRLIIEITETRPILHIEALIAHIGQVRRLGCLVAIDDFGAGFLSPSTLVMLEVDIVKIDASLLRRIRQPSGGISTFEHIVGFAKCNAPLVVVEGVEFPGDVELSTAAGATHVQGYYIAKPRAVRPFASMNNSRKRTVFRHHGR